MDLKLLLCLMMMSPAFGQNPLPQHQQTAVDLDRARSAWNFGGYHPAKAAALQEWARRQRNNPAVVAANRRQGTHPAAASRSSRSKKKSPKPQATPQYPGSLHRQYRHHAKPKHAKAGKRAKLTRNTKPQIPTSAAPTTHATVSPNYFPHLNPYYVKQQQSSAPVAAPLWNRGSRALQSRSDRIRRNFRKEDLWHLDKGEGYPLKNEDLDYDHFQRHFDFDSNSINQYNKEDEDYDFQNDEDQSAYEHEHDHDDDDDDQMEHDHDEDHDDHDESDNKVEEVKKPEPTRLSIAPLPRIHNPVPLGCLLTMPWFHPIRPRNHVACLLSIPGTPNLMKRRRRRSTDSQQPSQDQQFSTGTHPQASIAPMLVADQRSSTPTGLRKHYSSHTGNGKSPLPQPSVNSNLKVPATIIAPPKFDKSDILSMLMGSGGVNPTDLGTILATNTRYVRFGRGLPNSDYRKGRNINWFPETSNNQFHKPSVNKAHPLPPANNIQQPTASSSNQMPTIVLPPQSVPLPMKQQQPKMPKPSSPIIFNFHIAPVGSRPAPPTSAGTLITLPIPISPQQAILSPSPQQIPSPSAQAERQGDFKSVEYWKPVYGDNSNLKLQKPLKFKKFNSNTDLKRPSESTPFFSQTKAETHSQFRKKPYSAYNSEYGSAEYYDYGKNVMNYDNSYSSVLPEVPNRAEKTKNWRDVDVSQSDSDIFKSFSYAVKKNNLNSNRQESDSLPYTVLSPSSDYYLYNDGTLSEPVEQSLGSSKSPFYDNNGNDNSGHYEELRLTDNKRNNNDEYFYSVARKLTERVPDPIIIYAPKEGSVLNDIKK